MERVGWRVQVFWEGEAAWFDGVISEYSPDEGFLVAYDDGEEQWEVRACARFRQVTDACSLIIRRTGPAHAVYVSALASRTRVVTRPSGSSPSLRAVVMMTYHL